MINSERAKSSLPKRAAMLMQGVARVNLNKPVGFLLKLQRLK